MSDIVIISSVLAAHIITGQAIQAADPNAIVHILIVAIVSGAGLSIIMRVTGR